MDLVFCTEARFICQSSKFYSVDGGITDILLERYLLCFAHVYIMARVLRDKHVQVNDRYLINNSKVSFIELPYYIGPYQYLRVRRQICHIMKKEVGRLNCAYICRVPGQLSKLLISFLKKRKIHFGIEVVGDPWDVFAPGAIKHPLRVYFRYSSYWSLKKIVKSASVVLYVTQQQLQNRYPAYPTAFQIAVSDVQVQDTKLPKEGKRIQEKPIYTLLAIGSLEQMYKAPDIGLQALLMLKERNIHCRLIWLGEGKYKTDMENLKSKLGINNLCSFVGNVPKEEVYHYLSEADIFLMVSRTEGLPRALIEAMAVGLPCIGTRIGGIPELLSEDVLIPIENAKALCDKIDYMTRHIEFMNAQAKRNHEEAKKYYDSVLQEKRNKFYQHLISISK